MATTLRLIGAVIAGMVVAIILVVAVEAFGEAVHPFPKGVEPTEAAICAHVERFPQWALAVAVALWAVTALASTWVAGRIGNRYCAWFVGLLLIAGLALNLWKL